MLNKEDLGQIRAVVHDEVTTSEKRVIKTIVEAVGEMINDNIVPQLDSIYGDMGELKKDMKDVKQEIRTINAKMVTKGVLEDRLTDFRLSLSGTAA